MSAPAVDTTEGAAPPVPDGAVMVTLKIARFNPEDPDAAGWQSFRVPCLLVSPFARGGGVSNLVLDHASILSFIEWRWKTKPLTVRDAEAINLAEALDFDATDTTAPVYPMDPGPYATFCAPAEPDKWETLRLVAERGFHRGLDLLTAPEAARKEFRG